MNKGPAHDVDVPSDLLHTYAGRTDGEPSPQAKGDQTRNM